MVKAYTFLNLASPEVLNKFDTFDFERDEDREDVLVQKFEQLFLPVKNVSMDRHAFNTTTQKQHESIQSYVSLFHIAFLPLISVQNMARRNTGPAAGKGHTKKPSGARRIQTTRSRGEGGGGGDPIQSAGV